MMVRMRAHLMLVDSVWRNSVFFILARRDSLSRTCVFAPVNLILLPSAIKDSFQSFLENVNIVIDHAFLVLRLL